MNRLFRSGAVATLTVLGFAGVGATPMAAASGATSTHVSMRKTTSDAPAGQHSVGLRSAATAIDGHGGQVLAKGSRLRHRTTHSGGSGRFAWWMVPLFAIPIGIAGVALFLFFRAMKRKR